MRLRKLHLRVIGIFGPNGCGKSNMLLAAYAALTGDWRRFGGKTKESAISQTMEAGGDAWVEVTGSHNNVDFRVKRWLSSLHVHLESTALDGLLTKTTEVNAWLSDLLGIGRPILDNFVFVGQGDMTNFLSVAGAERAKIFSRLCQTTHAEACWSAVTKQIDKEQRLLSSPVADLDAIRVRVARHKKEIATAAKQAIAAKKQLPSKAAVTEAKQVVDTYTKRESLQPLLDEQETKHAAAARQVAELRVSNDKAQEKYKLLLAKYKEKTGLAESAKTQINEYASQAEKWDAKQRLQQELDTAEATRVSLEKPVCPDLPERSALETKRDKYIAVVLTTRTQLRTLLASGVAECETCGADLSADGAKQRTAQFEKRLATTEKKLADCESLIDAWEEYETQLREHLEAHKAQIAIISRSKRLLEAEGVAALTEPTPIASEDLHRIIAGAKAVREELYGPQGFSGYTSTAEIEADNYKCAVADLKAIGSSLETTRASLAKLGEATEKQRNEAAELLSQNTTLLQQLRDTKTRYDMHTEQMEEAQKELEDCTLQTQKVEQTKAWLETLTTVAGSLHRDAIPRLVHQQTLQYMEESINQILQQFDSPFWVSTDEELQFIAHFQNGVVMAGAGLSGGEKSILSLAFHFTLNSLFTNQLGLLSLDEPTAWIDSRNLDCLEAALLGLRQIAKDQGYQVLLSTHHEQLHRVFDQTIILDAGQPYDNTNTTEK